MVYGKFIFNNVKDYTPSWVKTIPYSLTTKPTFRRKPQVVSKFNADPKVKRFWRWFGQNIQKNPFMYQCFLFLNAYVIFHICYDPWLLVYKLNNQHRSIETAIQKEKDFKKAQKDAEGDSE